MMNSTLPTLIAHSDWSTNPGKRWMARARLDMDGIYTAYPAEPVGETAKLLGRLKEEAGGGPALAGFDFPIGVPLTYAQKTGVTDFLELLPELGQGAWSKFFLPAGLPAEISLYRPFYPLRPGQARQQHLVEGLQVSGMAALYRSCDLPQPHRRAACPIFWTMGGQQVGKAALCGWREVLQPALAQPVGREALAIWPFSGSLETLLKPGAVVAAETYPAEYYRRLGVDLRRKAGARWGKRVAEARRANAPAMLTWAEAAQVRLDPALQEQIETGFGKRADGEDRFDAAIGLFGMLEVALGRRPEGAHPDQRAGQVEGWILGLEAAQAED